MKNQFWAVGCGLGQTVEKRGLADYEQLLRPVFSLFRCQKKNFKLVMNDFENIFYFHSQDQDQPKAWALLNRPQPIISWFEKSPMFDNKSRMYDYGNMGCGFFLLLRRTIVHDEIDINITYLAHYQYVPTYYVSTIVIIALPKPF